MPKDGNKVTPQNTGDVVRGLAAGQRVFDRYYLKRTLGEGGMGVVWLAHDRVLEQPVALKFLANHLFQDHHEVERLKHETRRNLKLAHPNIVRIHDFKQDAAHAAIAMEFVDGWSLWTMRVDKPEGIFEAAEIAPWIRQLCAALDYAHNHAQIVHRDLKPANLLLNSRGQLKVTDFGLSRDLGRRGKGDSGHPKIVGTDIYMSPQQWTGEPPAVADDVYSLGATIYELLTGKPPFFEGDIFAQVYEAAPPSMTERLHQFGVEEVTIPLVWEDTVAACLAKDASRRPESAMDVVARLGLMEGAKPAAAESAPIRIETPGSVRPTLPETAVPPVAVEAPASESGQPPPELRGRGYEALAWLQRLPRSTLASTLVMGALTVVALIWLMFSGAGRGKSPVAGAAARAAAQRVWQNGLGMKFVPVPETSVWFSIWETRMQDFESFVRESDHDMNAPMLTLNQRNQWRASGHSWRNPDFSQTPAHPVTGVTWRDAEAFCAWLTEKERKAGRLTTNQFYRLPTATEWMQAAGDAMYPWGDGWPPPAGAGNYAGAEIHGAVSIHRTIAGYDDDYAGTAPVGSFAPNALGIYDLGGNVWEFCADGPADDPASRWMMGGSWDNATEELLAVANRSRGNDVRRYSHRGFRCVLAAGNKQGRAESVTEGALK